MRIAFLGDISLNDKYIELYKEGVNPFIEVNKILKDCDIVIGNLECFCKGNKHSKDNLPKLYTTKETLNFLKKIPVNIVSLANNHVGDNYEEGFNDTIKFLDKNDVKYLGAGYNEEEISSPLIIEKNNVKIAILNFSGPHFKHEVPDDCSLKVNKYDKNKIIEQVISIKKETDHVILLFHWGARIERGYFPDFYQFKDAEEFINSGVSLIVGHHSHTFQPFIKIKNSYVFFSLGNFCFSDFIHNNRVAINDKKRAYLTGIPIFEVKDNSIILKKTMFFKNKMRFFSKIERTPKVLRINQILINAIKFKVFWSLYFFYLKKIDWIIGYFFRSGRSFKDIYMDFSLIRIKRAFVKLIYK